MSHRAQALLALLAALSGCGGTSFTDLPFEDVTMAFFRDFPQGTYDLRSQQALEQVWAQAPFRVFPIGIVFTEPALPVIPFEAVSVVGISLGVGKYCFSPKVDRVKRSGRDVVVVYHVVTSGTLACMFDGPRIAFAQVPKIDGVLRFEEQPAPDAARRPTDD